jgi:hypothetical protein
MLLALLMTLLLGYFTLTHIEPSTTGSSMSMRDSTPPKPD